MTQTNPDTLYCANHPNVETSLRCNRCEKPICIKCAVLTPTGYRCKECVRGQQKTFDTAEWYDYPLAFIIVSVLALLGCWFTPILGFLTIFAAPLAGGVIAEAVRFVVRRRRSMNLYRLIVVAAVLGCLPVLGVQLIGGIIGLSSGYPVGIFMDVLWSGLYMILMTTTLYYRVAGIRV